MFVASRFRFALAVCLLLSLLPALLLAQSSSGSISGTVTDESGAVVPGVSISATNRATGAVRTTVTNTTGHYELALLPPAVYAVSASLEGFQPINRDAVTVNVGSVTGLDLRMTVGVSEALTVIAAAPLVGSRGTHSGFRRSWTCRPASPATSTCLAVPVCSSSPKPSTC